MTDDRSIGKATRYRHLVEHTRDAIVEFEFVGETPMVRWVNEAFIDIFGYSREVIEGASLNDLIVPEWHTEEARHFDTRTIAGDINHKRVQRETATGLRQFLYRGIPYEDDELPVDGAAIYTDLTDLIRQRRQLKVLNRVLRHNLRNQVNLIAGHTTRLLDAIDEPSTEHVETAVAVEQAARNLETLTQEADRIEDVIAPQPGDVELECVSLLQAVVADMRRQYPAATIRMRLPEALSVRADHRLRFAIEGLIDNAIRHNPAETPIVEVTATEADSSGWADVCVDDNGPRIPATERAIINGDIEMDSTRHGSGLGLWLIKWTTELYGGDVSITTSDLGGNRVCLRLLCA